MHVFGSCFTSQEMAVSSPRIRYSCRSHLYRTVLRVVFYYMKLAFSLLSHSCGTAAPGCASLTRVAQPPSAARVLHKEGAFPTGSLLMLLTPNQQPRRACWQVFQRELSRVAAQISATPIIGDLARAPNWK